MRRLLQEPRNRGVPRSPLMDDIEAKPQPIGGAPFAVPWRPAVEPGELPFPRGKCFGENLPLKLRCLSEAEPVAGRAVSARPTPPIDMSEREFSARDDYADV